MPCMSHLVVWLRTVQLVACVLTAAAFLGTAPEANAQGKRASLSEDLAQKLRDGDFEGTTVIFTGTQARVDDVAARHGLRITKRLKSGAVLEVPAHRLEALATDSAVDHLSGNHPMRSQMTVTNQAIGADQVHAGLAAGIPGLTGAGVGIAIIDSGIANVPELNGRIVASVDFTDDNGPGLDEQGHGTHVAGIAAASGVDVNDDTSGVAPGAHLVSLKVLDTQGRGYAADVVAAIDWAVANKDKYQIGVINLSLGGPVLQSWRDDPVCQAVERAYRAGIVVVAAAGNLGKDALGRKVYRRITMPGNSPFAITVGASNTHGTPWRSDDTRASYSSIGPTLYDGLIKPDLLAPGNRIRGLVAPGSTLVKAHPERVIGNGRDARLELSGTSMATPVVAGAVADLLQANRTLSPVAIRVLLQYSAEPMIQEGLLGAGAGGLNVAAANELYVNGAVRNTNVAGQTIVSSQLVFGFQGLASAQNILWGSAENILWGSAGNILWGSAGNILWGSAGNILWGSAENILWGSAENILWGSAENILWGSAENILWGSAENILWGSAENILWGSAENILWGSAENI